MDKNGQNRGGARPHHLNDSPIAGYKKMRIEAFHMLEQLIESNNNLSNVVKDKHNLLKQASGKVQDLKARIEELEHTCSEHEGTEFILREKLEEQRQNIIDQEHDKVFKKDVN